jgi:hypothetical protein
MMGIAFVDSRGDSSIEIGHVSIGLILVGAKHILHLDHVLLDEAELKGEFNVLIRSGVAEGRELIAGIGIIAVLCRLTPRDGVWVGVWVGIDICGR